MIRTIPLIFVLFGCSQTADIDWAEELVVQTNVRDNLQVAVTACAEFSKDLIGEEYKLNYQSNRIGLDADDPAWFELAEIYEEFYDNACSHVDVEELAAVFADEYRNRFNEAELEEIVRFHKSNVGSEYVAANSELTAQINQLVSQRMAEGSVEAQAAFEAKLQEFWLNQELSPSDDSRDRQL